MTGDDQSRDAIGRQVKTARKLAGLTQCQQRRHHPCEFPALSGSPAAPWVWIRAPQL